MSGTGPPLAVSNLAWAGRPAEPYEKLLVERGVSGLEVAPSIPLGADPTAAGAPARAELRARWADRGLTVIGLQSLYFGRPELQLLAEGPQQAAFVDHTRRMADLCADLGGHGMIFGAPTNRVLQGLSVAEAMARAGSTLHEVGEHAAARGCFIALEALPTEMGNEFVHTMAEAIRVRDLAASAGVRPHLDTGCAAAADGLPISPGDLASVQVSGGVTGVIEATADQRAWAALLMGGGTGGAPYAGWISVELPPTRDSDEDNLRRIADAIATVRALFSSGPAREPSR